MSQILKSTKLSAFDILSIILTANDSNLISDLSTAILSIYRIKSCTLHNFSPAAHPTTLIEFCTCRLFIFIFEISVNDSRTHTISSMNTTAWIWLGWRKKVKTFKGKEVKQNFSDIIDCWNDLSHLSASGGVAKLCAMSRNDTFLGTLSDLMTDCLTALKSCEVGQPRLSILLDRVHAQQISPQPLSSPPPVRSVTTSKGNTEFS
jgi:hypothetical protein